MYYIEFETENGQLGHLKVNEDFTFHVVLAGKKETGVADWAIRGDLRTIRYFTLFEESINSISIIMHKDYIDALHVTHLTAKELSEKEPLELELNKLDGTTIIGRIITLKGNTNEG